MCPAQLRDDGSFIWMLYPDTIFISVMFSDVGGMSRKALVNHIAKKERKKERKKDDIELHWFTT